MLVTQVKRGHSLDGGSNRNSDRSGCYRSTHLRNQSPNRYSKMTDGEFEDTKRSSVLRAVVVGQKRLLGRREAEYVIEAKLRNDKDATPVAGEPSADPPLKRPAQDSTTSPVRSTATQ